MKEDVKPFIEKSQLAVDFYKAMKKELGEEQALKILASAFNERATDAGKARAKKFGNNSLEALAEHYHQAAAANPNMEVLEVTDSYIATKFLRCRFCEAFAELGVPELTSLLCASDYVLIEAYNPNMFLVRTKTLFDGDDCCDHKWTLKTEED